MRRWMTCALIYYRESVKWQSIMLWEYIHGRIWMMWSYLEVQGYMVLTNTNFYSGKNPELIEGDIFRIIVPLDDEYSFDYEISSEAAGEFTGRDTLKTTQKTTHKQSKKLTPTERKILEAVRINPNITQIQLAEQIGITRDGIRYAIRNLKSKGILERTGSRKNGSWIRRCPGEK